MENIFLKILFVNPTYSKGVKIMYEIAKRLPDKMFLVVGNSDIQGRWNYMKLKRLHNVEVMDWVQDMRIAYEKTYLLVNPTMNYETFGRTHAEAMVNGIPSIGSGRGALSETIGDSGDIVRDIFNVDLWVRKIKRYDDEKYYKKKSIICKK